MGAEAGTQSAVNQFEIILDDDWNLRIPEGYNYSDNHLYKDSEYSSYKVNGKEYDSYGNTEENNVLESPRMLIIRIKDGVIIEVYLSHS